MPNFAPVYVTLDDLIAERQLRIKDAEEYKQVLDPVIHKRIIEECDAVIAEMQADIDHYNRSKAMIANALKGVA